MTIPPEALHPASLVHRNGHIRAGSPRPGIRAGSPRPGIRAGSPRPGIPRQPRSCPPELADPMRWSGSWASYSGSVGCGWGESGSQEALGAYDILQDRENNLPAVEVWMRGYQGLTTHRCDQSRASRAVGRRGRSRFRQEMKEYSGFIICTYAGTYDEALSESKRGT